MHRKLFIKICGQRVWHPLEESISAALLIGINHPTDQDRARRSLCLDPVEGAFRDCDERDDAAYSPS